jgi:hypothetical protein
MNLLQSLRSDRVIQGMAGIALLMVMVWLFVAFVAVSTIVDPSLVGAH